MINQQVLILKKPETSDLPILSQQEVSEPTEMLEETNDHLKVKSD